MIGSFLHGETIQIVRWLRDDRNAHGQLRPVYADPVDVPGVGVDFPSTSEPRDGTSNRHISDVKIFLPPGCSVGARDEIYVRGDKYQVEGNAPSISNFFTGTTFATEVDLTKVTG